MTRLLVSCFSISLDGFGAGPDQTLEDPIGRGGMALHGWFIPTQSFQRGHGGAATGTTGPDDDFASRGMANLGAWIMGRNMFGPIRGDWPDESWKGWWGDDPPYHTDVFVLTHHPRKSFEMAGGTTFHFVSDGIDSALRRAREAAKGKDIRIGGGVSTVQDYLKARLVDEMRASGHLAAHYVAKRADVATTLAPQLRDGDILITLGAGDVWMVGEEILKSRA